MSPSKKKRFSEDYDHTFMYDLNLKTEKQLKISNLKHVPIEVNVLNSIMAQEKHGKPVG